MHLGLIGYGNIAAGLIARLDDPRVTQITILVRPGSDAQDRFAATYDGARSREQFVTDLDALVAAQPDLTVECAGHAAVKAHAAALLGASFDLVIASIGALADETLYTQITKAAAAGNARLILPSGAIGGLDILRAIAQAGKIAVTYRGIKPPKAWAGSPAEAQIDLDSILADLDRHYQSRIAA